MVKSFESDEFHTARTPDEAEELIKAGFEYVKTIDGTFIQKA